MTVAYLFKADNPQKKFTAVVHFDDGRRKTVHFGGGLNERTGKPYEDFTMHKDPNRRRLYDIRHQKKEDWTDMSKSGFWAKWILWSKPTLAEAIRYTERKFKVRIIRKRPPK